uniref:Ovule protein n=1 Tax=Syphacia muris TaxID=451379 RepID=A0A0N5AX42_9BILA
MSSTSTFTPASKYWSSPITKPHLQPKYAPQRSPDASACLSQQHLSSVQHQLNKCLINTEQNLNPTKIYHNTIMDKNFYYSEQMHQPEKETVWNTDSASDKRAFHLYSTPVTVSAMGFC